MTSLIVYDSAETGTNVCRATVSSIQPTDDGARETGRATFRYASGKEVAVTVEREVGKRVWWVTGGAS